MSLVHDFKTVKGGQIKNIRETNTIIKKLLDKLDHDTKEEKQNHLSEEIKLEMKKIKEMYLSYDSATLTSNITNIDLSQIIDCLAIEV